MQSSIRTDGHRKDITACNWQRRLLEGRTQNDVVATNTGGWYLVQIGHLSYMARPIPVVGASVAKTVRPATPPQPIVQLQERRDFLQVAYTGTEADYSSVGRSPKPLSGEI